MATPKQMAQPPRVKYVWASEALKPQPPTEWIIDGMFAAGDVGIVYGKPGSKKTWLMMDSAVCVACGLGWLGHGSKQVTSLLIDEESGPRRMNDRLGRLLRAHGADESTPLAYTVLEGFNLHTDREASIARLRWLLADTKARFVVIDALADIMAGGDENPVKETQPVMLALRRLAEEFQAVIVVIHHAGKNGEIRGSSSFSGAVELVLKVTSASGSREIVVKSEKERDVEALRFAAEISFTPEIVVVSSLANSPAAGANMQNAKGGPLNKYGASKRHVLLHLLQNGATFKRVIESSATACTSRAAGLAIYPLDELGLIYRTNPDASGAAEYDLTDEGRAVAIDIDSEIVKVAAQI